jgi:hypothetical protein
MDICLQQWTGLYIEPVASKPWTYECEDRRFILTRKELKKAVKKAKESAGKIYPDVNKSMMYERLGYTYADVYKLTTGEEIGTLGITMPSNRKFEADEDLSFLFWALYELWSFIFMAKDAMFEEE